MSIRNTILATILASAIALPVPAAADDPSNVMFIFDASGSMKRPAGNEVRINVAKRVFGQTLKSMPREGLQTGLIAFGHRRKKDCTDIELVSPLGLDMAQSQAGLVQGFEAIGETPIATAITQAGQALKTQKGRQSSIVLITDGIEECHGDPCAAAAGLKALGIDVKVHIVGFALGAGEGSKLQCVVDQTGGRYFEAHDASALQRTLAEVKQIVTSVPKPEPLAVVAPPAAPPQRSGKLIFEDKFDGRDLSGEQWDILNRNADRYIVEKGELLLVNPAAGGFRHKDASNIVRLKSELPDGDWEIIVDAKPQFQTGTDSINLGLMTDEKNYLNLAVTFSGSADCNRIEVVISRMSNGEETIAPKTFAGSGCGLGTFGNENTRSMIKAMETNGIRLVLQKRDRKYSGTFEIRDWTDAMKKPRTIVTDELTSLRLPGRVALHVGKLDPKRPSETAVRVEQIQVVAYE